MTLPQQIHLPLSDSLIESQDPKDLRRYLSDLVRELEEMYEEMTREINGDIQEFPPVLKDTDTSSTYDYDHQSGWYLRQNLIVDYWFDVQWSAISSGTPTGNLYIELPYIPFNAQQMPFSSALQTSTIAYGGGSILSINAIPETFRGEIWSSGSGLSTTNISANTGSGRLIGHIRYIGELLE